MEEKKPKKISLSTFFLIIAIIVIIVMGFIILNLYKEKKVAEEEVTTLANQVEKFQESLNEQQSKISEISTIINEEIGKKEESNNELKGTYKNKNNEGESLTYVFDNGSFSVEGSWNYKGTYEKKDNCFILKYTMMLNPKGNNGEYISIDENKVKNEKVTIIDDKNIKIETEDNKGTNVSYTLEKQ